MITYQDKVNAGEPKVLTVEKWNELIDSPKVKNICKTIAGLDPKAAEYNDRKQALKKRLPIIIPHAASFANGKRVSADATPSGLAMRDVDHVEN
ncbi:MAG: VirE protein, partial [Paludibacteraceae bacterium]|nr:VirE protein [Paludibacteraceae bacterium]